MAEEAAPKKALQRKPRLLIVEDEVLIRMVIAEAARSAGYRVVEAGTADAALAYIASGQRVHVVFSDVNMPGSMNGMDLAEKLAGDHPEIRVVLTSGRTPARIAPLAATFIRKPYSIQRVLALIAEALTQKPADG